MQTWETTYPLPQGKSVEIDQTRGRVTVAGWDQPEVKVSTNTTADIDISEYVTVEETGSALRITVKAVKFGLNLSGLFPSINLSLFIPLKTALKLQSGSGNIDIAATHGALAIEAGSGSITVQAVGPTKVSSGSGNVTVVRVDGPLELEGGSGTVSVHEVAGTVKLEVGSGNVTLVKAVGPAKVGTGAGRVAVSDVVGSLKVESGSGNVVVDRVIGEQLSVETGSGAVDMSRVDAKQVRVETGSGNVTGHFIAIHAGGEYKVETQAGRVQLKLPESAGLAVNLDSAHGVVSAKELPLQVTRSSRTELVGTMNGGGAKLYVYALAGIELSALSAASAGTAPHGTHEGHSTTVVSEQHEPSAPSAPVEPLEPTKPTAIEALVAVLKSDAALEQNEAVRRVLNMVEQGKLGPDEADEILRTLEEAEGEAEEGVQP